MYTINYVLACTLVCFFSEHDTKKNEELIGTQDDNIGSAMRINDFFFSYAL